MTFVEKRVWMDGWMDGFGGRKESGRVSEFYPILTPNNYFVGLLSKNINVGCNFIKMVG